LTKDQEILNRKTKGDASESALIKFAEPLHPIVEYRAQYKRIGAIPFNSSNKWMLAIHENKDSVTHPTILLMKGAPERVMTRCSKVLLNGKLHDM